MENKFEYISIIRKCLKRNTNDGYPFSCLYIPYTPLYYTPTLNVNCALYCPVIKFLLKPHTSCQSSTRKKNIPKILLLSLNYIFFVPKTLCNFSMLTRVPFSENNIDKTKFSLKPNIVISEQNQ